MLRLLLITSIFTCSLFTIQAPILAQVPVNSEGLQNKSDKNTGDMTAEALKNALEDNATPPAIVNIEQDEVAMRFCRNIETKADAVRFEMQMQRLEVMKGEINERIELLEARRAEYEKWLKKRDDFLDKTQNTFVAIMSKMDASAAAEQLALSDDMVAASILLKLKPAQSSAIMNELPPQKAANLTHILASAQTVPNNAAAN